MLTTNLCFIVRIRVLSWTTFGNLFLNRMFEIGTSRRDASIVNPLMCVLFSREKFLDTSELIFLDATLLPLRLPLIFSFRLDVATGYRYRF